MCGWVGTAQPAAYDSAPSSASTMCSTGRTWGRWLSTRRMGVITSRLRVGTCMQGSRWVQGNSRRTFNGGGYDALGSMVRDRGGRGARRGTAVRAGIGRGRGPLPGRSSGRRRDERHADERRGERRLADVRRSEEHTSELQSPCNLVCRLLLEKK